jgi:hypothetical protein
MAERRIGSELYKVEPLPAGEAIELYADLMRVATQATGRVPAILMAIANRETGAPDVMAEVAALAGLGDILRGTGSTEIKGLIDRIVTCASVKRPSGYAPVNLDEEFSGNLAAIFPVAKFVLEVNYADFFTESVGGGLLSGLRSALASGK